MKNIPPSRLANFLCQAYKLRENRYTIKHMDLAGLRFTVTLGSGQGGLPPRPITGLQSVVVKAERPKLKIFRCAPYSITKLSEDGLDYRLTRKLR